MSDEATPTAHGSASIGWGRWALGLWVVLIALAAAGVLLGWDDLRLALDVDREIHLAKPAS